MAPSCVVDPMDCIFEKRSSAPQIYKRAPPSGGEGSTKGSSNTTAIIAGATAGSLMLVLLLALFYYCLRKRRASKRIGQLQKFLPTFMDQEKTEKYFQKHGSSTTLVAEPPAKEQLALPSSAHHRTRSVPVAFVKGVTDHRNRHVERDGSMGQFQQISLNSESEKEDHDVKRTPSGRRARSATVTASALVKSSLHRSVSLNKHNNEGTTNSRSDPLEEDTEQSDKFAEGESLVAPNRFSVLLDFNQGQTNNRFSAMSTVETDPNFDPSRFSTASVMFDAKRTSEDSSRNSSEVDLRTNLPPHQQQHSFHSHHNSPLIHSREVGVEVTMQTTNQPAFFGGDKQELEDDDDDEEISPQQPIGAVQTGQHNYPRQEAFYPP
ncbi:hypothetical protein BGZ65_003625, partial [Modicella reniformis]